jgi:hypothetical protein
MRAASKAAFEPATSTPAATTTGRRGISREQIDAELHALDGVALDSLRLQWRNRWGRLAPAHLSRSLLLRIMVYRIQAETYGDLDRQIARRLDRLGQEAEDPASGATAALGVSNAGGTAIAKARSPAPPLVLKAGALLTREWQGRIERVMALEQGFAWNGKTYGSLSGVAWAISGVKWSGHRFFFGAKGRDKTSRERGTQVAPEKRTKRRVQTSATEATQ